MRWLFLCLLLLSFPASAAAQDCPDGTPEGMNPTGNPCQLCRAGELESLPPRTVCSDERRFSCDENGAYRSECVPVDPDDPDNDATTCMTNAPKGPACPSGLTCDMTEGFCRTFCASGADCRDGYACEDDRCVLPGAPDMGTADMGTPDMGPQDMGPDLGPTKDMGHADMSSSADVGRDVGGDVMMFFGDDPPAEKSGCCAVSAGADTSTAFLLLFAFFLSRRRHA